MLIRLFSFTPERAGDTADDFIRRVVGPAVIELEALDYFVAARAAAAEGDMRLVVTVWRDTTAVDESALSRPLEFERPDQPGNIAVELHQLDVALEFDTVEPPQILRVFRGRTRPGETDNYIELARRGTLADVEADHGPDALFLARMPEDSFLTVSAWSGWDRIAASTGGNVRQPIATRHSHLLESGTAALYEIVPNAPYGKVGGAPAGDETMSTRSDEEAPDLRIALPEMPIVAPGS